MRISCIVAITCYLLICNLNIYGQEQSKIDSLLTRLKAAKQDTEQVNILNRLGWELKYSDLEKAHSYIARALKKGKAIKFRKGIGDSYNRLGSLFLIQSQLDTAYVLYSKSMEIYTELQYKKGIAIMKLNIGNIYDAKGNLSKANQYFKESLELSKEINDEFGVASALGNIGLVNLKLGNYDKALQYYYDELKILEKLNKEESMCGTLVNMGYIYWSQEKYDKALETFLKGAKTAEKLNNIYYLSLIYINIGSIYKDKTLYDKALAFYHKSLEMSKKMRNNENISKNYTNIGIIYSIKKDYVSALKYYDKALSIQKKIGNDMELCSIYNNYGELYFQLKKYAKAIAYYNKAITLSKKTGKKESLKISYQNMAAIYEELKQFKQAYQYYGLYTAIKDSIFNDENSRIMEEMEAKYENEKKTLKIDNLNKEKALQKEKIGRQKVEIKYQERQKIAYGSGLALMLILAIIIFKGYKNKQKANKIITKQKEEVELQKNLVEERNKEILSSIQYAKRIQETILPPDKVIKAYFQNSFILYKPKDIVSGDFYWMEHAGDKLLYAAVDCTGHGVPGAFVSIVGYNGLNRAIKEFKLTQPAKILDKLNELVEEIFSKNEGDVKDGMDISICCFDQSNNVLEYAGANNPLYLIRKKDIVFNDQSPNIESVDHNLFEIKADKQPIGSYDYRQPFTNHVIHLNEGDSLYIFSDGYADQFGGPKGKKFKYKQFKELLLASQVNPMHEQKEILDTAIEKWKGDLEQIDDICIIGIKV